MGAFNEVTLPVAREQVLVVIDGVYIYNILTSVYDPTEAPNFDIIASNEANNKITSKLTDGVDYTFSSNQVTFLNDDIFDNDYFVFKIIDDNVTRQTQLDSPGLAGFRTEVAEEVDNIINKINVFRDEVFKKRVLTLENSLFEEISIPMPDANQSFYWTGTDWGLFDVLSIEANKEILDDYTLNFKIPQLNTKKDEIIVELDDYTDNTLKPELEAHMDNYVTTVSKPDLLDYTNNTLKPILDAIDDNLTYDTVADMKADTTLSVGLKVKTWGHTTLGDTLGAEYEIVAPATGTHDNWNYIDLTGISGQAKLIQKSLVETEYTNGGFLLGETTISSNTVQYLAGDKLWWKLKADTTLPYTHDASDTPDTDFFEKVTYKRVSDEIDKLGATVLASGAFSDLATITFSEPLTNFKTVRFTGYVNANGLENADTICEATLSVNIALTKTQVLLASVDEIGSSTRRIRLFVDDLTANDCLVREDRDTFYGRITHVEGIDRI